MDKREHLRKISINASTVVIGMSLDLKLTFLCIANV